MISIIADHPLFLLAKEADKGRNCQLIFHNDASLDAQ
jgi:hypothetical protein